MKKNELILSASELPKVRNDAAQDYLEKSEIMVSQVNHQFLNNSELLALIGEGNQLMAKDNHTNHAKFMASMFLFFDPTVFVDTILWVFRTYRSHGFHPNYWNEQLASWISIVNITLKSDTKKEVLVFYKWMQKHIPDFVRLTDSESDSEPHKTYPS